MLRATAVLPLTIAATMLAGCHTRTHPSSLAEMKRSQESRLMYACVAEYGTMVHGGLSLDLIQACQKHADALVW